MVGLAARVRGAQFPKALERRLPKCGFAYQPGGHDAVQGLAAQRRRSQAAAGQQVAGGARRARLDHQPARAQIQQPARQRGLADARPQARADFRGRQALGVRGEERQKLVFERVFTHLEGFGVQD